jgi:hypothetical protein
MTFQPLSKILIRFIKASDADLISPLAPITMYPSITSKPLSAEQMVQSGILHTAMTHGKILNLISVGSVGPHKTIFDFKAKSHWGKTGNFPHYANPVGILLAESLYPQLRSFGNYQHSIDPNAMVVNNLYKASVLGDTTA